MASLKETLAEKIPVWRRETASLIRNHGQRVISEVTLEQIFKGLRGVLAIPCDTSYVDPEKGLLIRGVPVLDLIDRSPEEVFFLLCTGEFPDGAALRDLQADINRRAKVPYYVWNTIHSMPDDTHPMVLLSLSMLAMQRESVFVKRYNEGMRREDHWEATLEDALDIIARLPVVAAGIYRLKILKEPRISPMANKSWVENLSRMLGVRDDEGHFRRFLNRFAIAHSDHEGANASVLTSRLADSTLCNLYYSLSAAMNCLSGPLHGLANQEMVKFVKQILSEFGRVPSDEQLSDYVWAHISSRKVVPGFGHAVLRQADPRFLAMQEIGREVAMEEPVYQVVERLSEVVPPLLIRQGKAKNPYANIDGISGAMLYHFGIRSLNFYTVMFSTAQSLGICAQLIINRALFGAIIRPRSVTTDWLKGQVGDIRTE
ncbi:MAG: citrate (Si)-synthase [Calditrichaeota bacterium]|nr:citrate (Si)-synthase [Calditrichota bacterium]